MAPEEFITIGGDLRMPTLGMAFHEMNLYFLGLLDEAMDLGVCHFEFRARKGVFSRMWERVRDRFEQLGKLRVKEDLDTGRFLRRYDYRNICFISATIHVWTRLGPKMEKILLPFLEQTGLEIVDVLYLENPFGGGADIRKYYEIDDNDPQVGNQPLEELFLRNPEDGKLMVEPIIQQNLWLIWKRMEKMITCPRPKARHLGLRFFSLAHIEELLKVVKIRPSVVEVEVNLYNMQLELRRVCREKNIAVVSVDPFGSRCRHQENRNRPFLRQHPVVVRIARQLRVESRTVMLRHLLQSGVPVVYDVVNFCHTRVYEQVWDIELSEEHMRRLDALERTGVVEDKTEFEHRCEKDPLWPFRVPPRKPRKRKLTADPSSKRPRRGCGRNIPHGSSAQYKDDFQKLFESSIGNERGEVLRVLREPLAELVRENFTKQYSMFGPNLLQEYRLKFHENIPPLKMTWLQETDLSSLEGKLGCVNFKNIGGDFDARSKDCLSTVYSRTFDQIIAEMCGEVGGKASQRRQKAKYPQDLPSCGNLGLNQRTPYFALFHMNFTE